VLTDYVSSDKRKAQENSGKLLLTFNILTCFQNVSGKIDNLLYEKMNNQANFHRKPTFTSKKRSCSEQHHYL